VSAATARAKEVIREDNEAVAGFVELLKERRKILVEKLVKGGGSDLAADARLRGRIDELDAGLAHLSGR